MSLLSWAKSPSANTAEGIAGFVARVGADALPPVCSDRLKLSLLDTLGCAIGGLGGEPVRRIRAMSDEFGGRGHSPNRLCGTRSRPRCCRSRRSGPETLWPCSRGSVRRRKRKARRHE